MWNSYVVALFSFVLSCSRFCAAAPHLKGNKFGPIFQTDIVFFIKFSSMIRPAVRTADLLFLTCISVGDGDANY